MNMLCVAQTKPLLVIVRAFWHIHQSVEMHYIRIQFYYYYFITTLNVFILPFS